jgi:cytochrome c oxidase cbb3-type subunit 1
MSSPHSISSKLPSPDAGEQLSSNAWMVEVDASCRYAVLFFYAGALFWLVVGSIFALVASWKMHSPDFLANISWLAFGRIRPVHVNAVIYGFATEMAFGSTIWILCRLCRTRLTHQWLVTFAGLFWNVGVTLGLGAILAGKSSGVKWLEFPSYTMPILFTSA